MADPTACAVTPAPSRPDLPIDAACETCGHYMYGGHRGHACDICRVFSDLVEIVNALGREAGRG